MTTTGGSTSVPRTIMDYEKQQVARANASGLQPVVFIHGLWLLPSSWDRWSTLFEMAGYTALTPGWPDDPTTVDDARAHPDVFAHKTIRQVADHFAEIIGDLKKKPAIVGHSFGGLLAEILAGRGLSVATVAISPAPFQGVLPLPYSALKSAWPVLENPANRNRAVPLTYEQFRFSFANAVDEDEAMDLYERFCVPASGAPLFQAATANFDPWTQDKVVHDNADRAPMLLVFGDNDNTVPAAIVEASFNIERRNANVTEIAGMRRRGHSLIIDSGWKEVADTALGFVERFIPATVL